jgi:hypothetical protein
MKSCLFAAFLAAIAGSAHAACDKRFDGLWGWEASGSGQCTVATFGNDSIKQQVAVGTWTNLSSSCDYVGANKILEAEYDNLRHSNLSAKMVSKDTCELTYGKAYVSVDQYGAWKPLSKKVRYTIVSRNRIEQCFESTGHQYGDCIYLEYSHEWK